MTDKLPQEERAFLKVTGLRPNNLAPLVADAPPLPADAVERIRARAHQKAGLTASVPAADIPAEPEAATSATPTRTAESNRSPHVHAAPAQSAPPNVPLRLQETARRKASRRPWWLVAAASLLLVGGTLFATNPEGAMAAIQRMVRLVPGIGLTATDAQTLVMVSPVSAESGDQRLTITGLFSDGEKTELRYLIEGLPRDKFRPDSSAPSLKPSLRLADGTVLETASSGGFGGSETFGGTLWFGPLPNGTTELTLSLPSMYGLTEPFEVAISVVDVGAAGLAEAALGGWSEEQLGIRIGVPYWTTQGDRIVLNLDASLPEGKRVQEIGEKNRTLQFAPVLTDEQGRVYPLIPEESKLWPNTGDHLSATFQGPLAEDAGRLRLSVPVLRVVEDAEAGLTVPLGEMTTGEPLRLDVQLEIGSQHFAVDTVTRVDAETVGFDLDLGTEQGGVLLQEVHIGPKRGPYSGGGSWSSVGVVDPETWQLHRIDYSPEAFPEGNMAVVFERPVIRLRGGWEIELPERAGFGTSQP